METFYANTDIRCGTSISIEDQNEISHAYSSLRIRPGEEVCLINGTGSAFICSVVECSRKSFVLMPSREKNGDTEYNDINIFVAVSMLNKISKMKLLTEKLTELGIRQLIPFVSKRTSFPKMNTGSLHPSMVSALKQCGGVRDVAISELLTFGDVLSMNGFDRKYFADINGESVPEESGRGNILLVIGPEGGFDGNEIDEMKERRMIPLKLNKRTLKAETAAIVAASKFLY